MSRYGALFACAGAAAPVAAAMRSRGVQDLVPSSSPRAFGRVPGRPAPYDTYASIAGLRAAGASRGYPVRQDIRPSAFRARASFGASSAPVASVTVPFSPRERVTWSLDRPGATWVRADNGRVYRDTSGQAVRAGNVVVLWTRVTRTAKRDENGVVTIDIGPVGSGRSTVFRGDGARIDGTWSANAATPLVLNDSQGRPAPLLPGTTWFQIIPNDIDITMR
jgi:hypothetical protein